jgi:formate-dependent nitrite reductase cytochrome c552 subunit
MVKKIVLCIAALAMVCGVAAVALAQGPESVTFDTAKKAGTHVTFNHKAHQAKQECATCHHTKNADGTQGPYVAGEEKKCATCHELGKPSDVIHKNCKGCHKDGGAGPTGCNDCHVK